MVDHILGCSHTEYLCGMIVTVVSLFGMHKAARERVTRLLCDGVIRQQADARKDTRSMHIPRYTLHRVVEIARAA